MYQIILATLLLVQVANAQEIEITRSIITSQYTEALNVDELIIERRDPEITKIEKEIEQKEQKIRKTEAEINSINRDLNSIYKKKDSLEGELKELTLVNRKTEADIRVTEDTIYKGQLKLKSLNKTIDENVSSKSALEEVLAKSFQQKNEHELEGEVLNSFLSPSFFEAIQIIEELERYSDSLMEQLNFLDRKNKILIKNKSSVAKEGIQLTNKQKELVDRKKLYNISIDEKEKLVSKTKNDETRYQELLKEKKIERLDLQREIYEYETRINYLQDPNSIPKAGTKLLGLPFEIKSRITQSFGDTPFARANSLKYGRPFHDGLDFGVPSGTKLVSTADGVVIGLGNTDIVRSCQSWGKWILIEHSFGLTTLYAHLSLIKVNLGEKVKSGELIGYSGNTGFSTGAHLHLGVYDSNGISVVPYSQVSSSSRCRGLDVPVAAQDAKLNPSDYL